MEVEKTMNLNIDKSVVLSVLLFSAIFAVTMISTASLATRALRSDPAGHSDNENNENNLTLTYIGDPVKGACIPCGGDPVGGGGHP
jgi:cytochrome bd-type quinol oxidase subunit 1